MRPERNRLIASRSPLPASVAAWSRMARAACARVVRVRGCAQDECVAFIKHRPIPAMCEIFSRYKSLAVQRTLCESLAMCGTRQKSQQKQPPDRRAMCALLSCHPPVVSPASHLCALTDTLACDPLRLPPCPVIPDLRPMPAPRAIRSTAVLWQKYRTRWSQPGRHPLVVRSTQKAMAELQPGCAMGNRAGVRGRSVDLGGGRICAGS